MGKTFKYGYSGNSFRSLERHAEQKINDRRKVRRMLKDTTRAEINNQTSSTSKKFDLCNSTYRHPYLYKPNAIASWGNLNFAYKSNGSINTYLECIGKKQLKRRGEIGKKSLLNRRGKHINNEY